MKNAAKLFVVVVLVSSVTFGATILHYDFEDGTPGVPMNDFPVTQQNGTVGTADLSVNGYDMHSWDDYWGPWFSADGDTPTGTGLSSVHQSHNDGYTLADGIRRWSPGTWTIELSFKLNDPSGWRTLIGRDDWTGIDGDIGPSLQVQSNGIDDGMRVAFVTVSNEHYELFSTLIPEPGKWYHLAVVTDGDRLDMYADQFDGNGFQNIGTLIMDAGIDHSLLATGNWTFGRGWFNGNFVDHIDGNMDNIRFSDEALTIDQFLPEPATSASNYVTSTDQGGLVPIINRDFSEPNDGKHTAFDIETSRKQDEPFFGFMTTDVPGWTTDVSVKDSGIEIGDDPNYGYSAFLLGGYSEWDDDPNWVEPSIWQILPYKIQQGDQFRLAVDARHIWTVEGVPVELKMTLFYVDINGTRQELASLIVDLTEAWEWSTYILDVPELPEMAVGKILGIELQNITERSSWIHVDNVSLIGE